MQLQYRAYQSEAELFGGEKIPPLPQTLEERDTERDSCCQWKSVILIKDMNCSQVRRAKRILRCMKDWDTAHLIQSRLTMN